MGTFLSGSRAGAAILFSAAVCFWAGCGGGGGDDDDDFSGATGATFLAPEDLRNRQMQIQIGDETSTLLFSSQNFSRLIDGVPVGSGSFTFSRQTVDQGVLVLNETVPIANVRTFQLTFQSTTSGIFTLQDPTGQIITGTFFNLTIIRVRDGVDGGDDFFPPGDEAFLAPERLTGRTAEVLEQSGRFPGASYFITFVSPTEFTSSIDGSAGIYNYVPTGTEATLVLEYTTGPLRESRDVLNLFFRNPFDATFSGFIAVQNSDPIFFAGIFSLLN